MFTPKHTPSRLSRIHAAVQVAVDFAFDVASAKQALKALDKACSHSELSASAPIASAIRLLVFYADFTPDSVPHEDRSARLDQLKSGIKRLAGLMLVQVGPSRLDHQDQSKIAASAPDFKMRAAGDTDD